jgi:glycerol-3-phosphate dehydrogenase (NAD(P)+)
VNGPEPAPTRTRIAVVGAGAWGTTLAAIAAAGADAEDTRATLWALEPAVADAVNNEHTNTLFLPDFALPRALRATTSIDEALDGADAVIMAVPSQFFRPVFREVAPRLSREGPVLSVVKGIERHSLKRMTEIMSEESDLDASLIGVLSGPNVAREIAAEEPAATVIALGDLSWAERLQRRLMTPTFRVYTNTDVVGCEISGAVKNVIAIAAGVADGLGYGANTKAALLTRGLAELARLGTALGGQPLTFLGLAGNGDLVATCSSEQSRNHRVGVELARGRAVEEIVATLQIVAEGIETTPGVLALANRVEVDMPIAEQVSAVLRRERSPQSAVDELMGRDPRPELDDMTAPPDSESD